MKRTTKQIAKAKLEHAEKVFYNLELKLAKNEEFTKKSMEKTLIRCAINYHEGTTDLQKDACITMYNLFKVTPWKYPGVTDNLKIMLRHIVKHHFSNNPQLNLF